MAIENTTQDNEKTLIKPCSIPVGLLQYAQFERNFR